MRAQGELNVFENVTAILRRARVPARSGAGGGLRRPAGAPWPRSAGAAVCFELAPLFRRLLAALGYQVTPILAQISFPGSHHATIVDLDGVRSLVDVGSGAPLWRPFPLQETVEVHHAGLSFRFRPDGPGVHLQERLIDGAWEAHCRYDLRPASAARARPPTSATRSPGRPGWWAT